MQITIEKNVPLPRLHGRGLPSIYPFADMEVGDSFAVPLAGTVRPNGTDATTDIAAARLANAAQMYARRNGGKFSVRTLKDEGVVRVWRVA